MDVLILLTEAQSAGLTLAVEGGRLRIRGPKEAKALADKLGARKPEVIAELRRRRGDGSPLGDTSPENAEKTILVSPSPVVGAQNLTLTWHRELLMDGHDWESPLGYFPSRRTIRGDIEHKLDDCPGVTGWRHVWGGVYCTRCWPATDAKAVRSNEGEP